MALKPKIGTMTENQCGADIMSRDEKLNLLSYALNSQTMATASNSEDDLDSFPEISPVEAAACPETAQNDANGHRKKHDNSLGREDSSSSSTENPPPLSTVERCIIQLNPSPLTVSNLIKSNERMVSMHRVAFEEAGEGLTLSVPMVRATRDRYDNEDTYGTYRDGYDSDGQQGPFFDAVANENNAEVDKDPMESEVDEATPAKKSNTEIPPAMTPTLTEEEVKKMTLNQLREECRKRKLAVGGNKAALQGRLLGAVNAPVRTDRETGQEERVPGCFAPTAKWRELKQNNQPVPEPINNSSHLRGLTVPEGEKDPMKYDFSEVIDRPPFVAESKVIELNARGKVVLDRDKKPKYINETREKGRANLEWLRTNKLTQDSLPVKWFEALLPTQKKPGDPSVMVTIDDWTRHTNLRAVLSNASNPGHLYPDWKPFTVNEIRNFIALYILQGLCPSPQVKQKFKPQHEAPINGNDLCHKIFGSNGDKRHKQFKTFFAIQDPKKDPPNRKDYPNWKVDPFLAWMQVVS